MKKTIIIMAAVSIISCFTVPAVHAGDCADAGDMVSIAQCHEDRYIKADRELNAIYREAMKTLSGNEKQKLQTAQKAWLKFRDASFDFVIEQNRETRSYGNIVVSRYKADVVEKRVLELKYLLSGPEGEKSAW